MIESPAFVDFEIDVTCKHIGVLLENRFGPIPEEIRGPLDRLENLEAMNALLIKATTCRDFAEFKRSLVRYKSNRT